MKEILNFLGHLHPLIVHLPIGIMSLLVLFEWVSYQSVRTHLRSVLTIMAFWAMLSAVFSCVAGYLLSLDGGYDEVDLTWHKWSGIGLGGISMVYYFMKRWEVYPAYSGKFLSICFIVMLGMTGHFGGVLTHGETYLSEPFAAIFNGETKKIQRKPVEDLNKAIAYTDLIEPVFEEKCYQCHNGSKQKGNLRMDAPELLLKGGKSGKVLIPGNPDASEIYKRLLLPEDDEHHMPPKGKSQFTEKEIALLHWWISTGSSATALASKLPGFDSVQSFLIGKRLTDTASNRESESIEFAEQIPPASEKDISKLVNLNVFIEPVAAGSSFLMVNTVNSPSFGNAQMELILPLKQQLAWLKIGNTNVSGPGFKVLSQLQHLTRLHLENTAFGDEDIKSLFPLTHLQYLNLVGTKVSDNGISQLKSLSSLKKVYLWQTSVTEAGIAELRKLLPNTEFNLGIEGIAQITRKHELK